MISPTSAPAVAVTTRILAAGALLLFGVAFAAADEPPVAPIAEPPVAPIAEMPVVPIAEVDATDLPGPESECDITMPMLQCHARPQMEGNDLLLETMAPGCALVEWSLDGEPRQTLMLTMRERVATLDEPPKNARRLYRRVKIHSCTEVVNQRVSIETYRNRRPVQLPRPAGLSRRPPRAGSGF